MSPPFSALPSRGSSDSLGFDCFSVACLPSSVKTRHFTLGAPPMATWIVRFYSHQPLEEKEICILPHVYFRICFSSPTVHTTSQCSTKMALSMAFLLLALVSAGLQRPFPSWLVVCSSPDLDVRLCSPPSLREHFLDTCQRPGSVAVMQQSGPLGNKSDWYP